MQKRKHFIKKKEDFVCENCGVKIKGTGYTNHCPNCLFSKHVDKELPGDRLSKCQGIMEPVASEYKSGKWVIYHKCQKCGKVSKNKAGPCDNNDRLIELSKKPIEKS